MKILIAFCTLALALSAHGQSADELAAISEPLTFELDGRTLPYRLFKPIEVVEGETYPVYLALHGAGARESDNYRTLKQDIWAIHTLASDPVREEHPCYIIVPQCPKDESWVKLKWNHGSYKLDEVPASPYLSMLMPLLNQVLEAHPIDEDRIYVGGYSMGGYGTWDLIARNPNVFAAAVPVCGSDTPGAAALIKHIPIWVFHGDKDKTVPTQGSRDMVAALKRVGASVKYTELPNTGHNAWQPTWKTEGLVEWLFSQSSKDPAPE